MSVDWRGLFLRVALVAPLVVSGCIERAVHDGAATYRFAWWAMAGLVVGGLLSIFASRFVPTRTDGWYRFTRKIRWGLISVGVVALFVTVVMYSNGVTVSPEGFTGKVGFFGEKVHRVKFGDLERVEFIAETSGLGRSRKTNYYFLCVAKNGASDKVPLSGSCMQAALPQIVAALQAARIPIINNVSTE